VKEDYVVTLDCGGGYSCEEKEVEEQENYLVYLFSGVLEVFVDYFSGAWCFVVWLLRKGEDELF